MLRFRRYLPAALWLASLCPAQTPGPQLEEVKVSSRPYLPTIRADANIAELGVVVRDDKGRAVAGLAKEDFQVLDEGKPRAIANFIVTERTSQAASANPVLSAAASASSGVPGPVAAPTPMASAPPRFIALYFDDLSTPEGDLARTKKAAQRFIEDGVTASDRVAVFTTQDGPATQWTGDKKTILAAIDKVRAHMRYGEKGSAGCPRITPYDAYMIAVRLNPPALNAKVLEAQSCNGPPPPPPGGQVRERPSIPPQIDASVQTVRMLSEQLWTQVEVASQESLDALRSIIDNLSRAPGNRMLLMVSSGFLTGTMEPIEDSLATRALRAGVVINAIDAKGLFIEDTTRQPWEPPISQFAPPQVFQWEALTATDAKELPNTVMSDLTSATGGLFFHKSNDYSFGFRELGSIPEVSYVLTFKVDDIQLNGKYRKLKVKLASPRPYELEYRPGYFALPGASPQTSHRAELDRLVASLEPERGLPATAGIDYGLKTPAGLTPVKVQIHVDVKSLAFSELAGRRGQDLTFVAALYDGQGRLVAAREGEMKLALTQSKFDSIEQNGLTAVLNLDAPSGSYRLRLVALDAQGKAAGLAYAVSVP